MNTSYPKRDVEKIKPLAATPEIAKALKEVQQEVMTAKARHGKWHSAHEGYAVLAEEVDELWDEVKKRSTTLGGTRDIGKLRREACQVAAMAIRFMTEIGQ